MSDHTSNPRRMQPDDEPDPYANPPHPRREVGPSREGREPWWKSRVFIAIVAFGVGVAGGLAARTHDDGVPGRNAERAAASSTPTPSPSASSSTMGIIMGTLDLTGSGNFTKSGTSCTGTMGFDDIKPGAEVDISNGSGETVSFANLGNGIVSDGNCQFVFTFDSVPRGEAIYKVTIGNRPGPSFRESGLEDGIALTLGG